MPLEDFTTYTETDPNSTITVTSDTITMTDTIAATVAHVIKDFRNGYFKNFKISVKYTITSISANGFSAAIACSNTASTVVDMSTAYEGLLIYGYVINGTPIIYIKCYETNNSDSYETTLPTTTYITFERIGTASTAKIYSDEAKTTLLDTISITSGTMPYKRMNAMSNRKSGAITYRAIIEDLEILRNDTSSGRSARINVTKGVIIK